jgi:hypothetical protein
MLRRAFQVPGFHRLAGGRRTHASNSALRAEAVCRRAIAALWSTRASKSIGNAREMACPIGLNRRSELR